MGHRPESGLLLLRDLHHLFVTAQVDNGHCKIRMKEAGPQVLVVAD